MGTKCDDYFVCRICEPCHKKIQGKYQMSLDRLGRSDDWTIMLADNNQLLADYAAYLEGTIEHDTQTF